MLISAFSHDPVPRIGWKVKMLSVCPPMALKGPAGIFVIGKCTCFKGSNNGWPDGDDCGAHLYRIQEDGTLRDTKMLCYMKKLGWLWNFELADAPPPNHVCVVKDAPGGKIIEGLKRCPLCGCEGVDMLFKFYCSCSTCQNFR